MCSFYCSLSFVSVVFAFVIVAAFVVIYNVCNLSCNYFSSYWLCCYYVIVIVGLVIGSGVIAFLVMATVSPVDIVNNTYYGCGDPVDNAT